MTVFFLAIGLEIGRERATGSLSENANAVMPVVAALGGMAGAAGVYLLVGPGLVRRAAGASPWRPTSPSPWVCSRYSAGASRAACASSC